MASCRLVRTGGGGWITIIFAAGVLYNQKDHARLCLFLGSIALSIFACLLVLDISRVSSFAFPLIPVSYILLQGNDFSPREMRIFTGAGAATSLLAPNFEIITGLTIKWLTPFFAFIPFIE